MDEEDDWENPEFLHELFAKTDEVSASRNPNPTPAPVPSSAPAPAHDSCAVAPISYVPAGYAPVSYLPAVSTPVSASAVSCPSPLRCFSPPRELTERPPVSLAPVASGDGDALATVGRGFSPPRELSQRPTTEESGCAIVGLPGPTVGDRTMCTGGNVGAKREREAREVERLKRELDRVSKKMNDLKNECNELRKDRTKREIQIRAKEAEIQNLKMANGGFAAKEVCGVGMNVDHSIPVSANGALHAASTRASTRADKSNGKVMDSRSLQEDMCLKQRHQTDSPQALELKDHTMIDNTTGTYGGFYLEESPHLEPRSVQCKEIKTTGVQTDNTWDSEHLDCKRILLERISSNLRAVWGLPTNSLSGRNLISKIIVSCSEEILALLQCTRLPEKSGSSSEISSSLNDAISQLYDIFVKMSNEKIPIQTFLEALIDLCSFENVFFFFFFIKYLKGGPYVVRCSTQDLSIPATLPLHCQAAIVGRTLRILQRVLQHLLKYGTSSSRSVHSGTMFLLNHIWTSLWRTSIKTALPC